MGEPLDATEVWAQALRGLWEAAGRPTGATIIRQAAAQVPPMRVSSSSWSDWRRGRNVPADARTARWLVIYLRSRARRKSRSFVTGDDAWWERAWKEARAERPKGGRPPRPLPTGEPAALERILVGVIPQKADCFQAREAGTWIAEGFAEDGTVVLTQVLTGIGGGGKTQLAAAHALHMWDQGVGLLVWVNASSRDQVVSAYAEAALRLGLPLADPKDAERSARQFLSWARTTTDRRWLVVLDDVHNAKDLREWWPTAATSAAGGHVLITTRLRGAALARADWRMIEIGTFTEQEARSYLQDKVGDRITDPALADGLAEDLGRLPLALAQAAAYIFNENVSIQAYRHLLATKLLREVVPEDNDLTDDHQRIITATWELTIAHADAARPAGLARPVLQLASVLDPAGIPQQVLTSPQAVEYLTIHLPESAHRKQVDAELVETALRVLHRYSLIDHNHGAHYREVRVHQLVQRATRESLGASMVTALAGTVADALLEVWPETERDELGRVLRGNATALHESTGTALWQQDKGLHEVLFLAATSLGESGQVTAAINAYNGLLTTAATRLGPDHPHTLAIRHHLARWRGEAGDTARAIADYQELLTDALRCLDPGQPLSSTLVIAISFNLARLRGEAGDAAGAVAEYERLLADAQSLMGPNHPDTLSIRHSLAQWRGEAGDAAGAVAAYEELLADVQRLLGPEHPNTFPVRHNLAYWRERAGTSPVKASEYRQLLTEQLHRLGPDHPGSIVVRENLAHLYGESGDAAGAVAAYEELLPDVLRMLGPEHPNTFRVRSSLAQWQGNAGDAAEAAVACEEVLADVVRVLGPDHRTTLLVRDKNAYLRGKAGDATGAVAAYEELLADALRVLSPTHPDIVAIYKNLAYWRAIAGIEDPMHLGALPTIPQFKVVMLGLPGSGKTTLLASMYQQLRNPAGQSYFLHARSDFTSPLAAWWARMQNTSHSVAWPDSTEPDKVHEFILTLKVRAGDSREETALSKLAYVDSSGELLINPQAAPKAKSALLQHVRSANALIAIIDGGHVRQHMLDDPHGRANLERSLDAIAEIMDDPSGPIHFVITKWDLLTDLDSNERALLSTIRQLLMGNQRFRSLVDLQDRQQRTLRLIPVSLFGPAIARIGTGGSMTRIPGSAAQPPNGSIQVSAVIPDLFEQVSIKLGSSYDVTGLDQIRQRGERQDDLRYNSFMWQFLAAFGPVIAGTEDGLVDLFIDFKSGNPDQQPEGRPAEPIGPTDNFHEAQNGRRIALHEMYLQIRELEETFPESRITPQ